MSLRPQTHAIGNSRVRDAVDTRLDGEGPFLVEAGAVGIGGARWEMPKSNGARFAATDEIRRSTADVTGEIATQNRYLASRFNRLTDSFGFADEITPAQVVDIVQE